MGNKYDRVLEEKGHKKQRPEKVPVKQVNDDRRKVHSPRQHPKFERDKEE